MEAEFVRALHRDLERLAGGVGWQAGGFVERQHGGERVVLRACGGDEDFGEREEDFADDVVGVFVAPRGVRREVERGGEEGRIRKEFFDGMRTWGAVGY